MEEHPLLTPKSEDGLICNCHIAIPCNGLHLQLTTHLQPLQFVCCSDFVEPLDNIWVEFQDLGGDFVECRGKKIGWISPC